MPVPVGLLLTGVVTRMVLGTIVVAALVFFLWKVGKLADTYTERLRAELRH